MFCRDGDDQSLNLTLSFGCFFGEGAMRRTRGCLGNTPTFLAVCEKCSRLCLWTGDAGHGPPGSTHSYPDWAAFPAAFFLPLVDRTMAGVHDLLRRFSHFLSPGISKKVRWSSNEGHWPLEVRSPGAFLCSFRLLVGNLPPRATAQSMRASSVGYVQLIPQTIGYAAIS